MSAKISQKTKKEIESMQLENEFTNSKKLKFKRILTIDYGSKFCGLAFTIDGITVLPLEIISTKNLDEKIREILATKKIELIVFGLPISDDNSENSNCRKIREISKKINKLAPVAFVSERMSSQAIIKKSKTKERIDDLAAMRILEFYLQSC